MPTDKQSELKADVGAVLRLDGPDTSLSEPGGADDPAPEGTKAVSPADAVEAERQAEEKRQNLLSEANGEASERAVVTSDDPEDAPDRSDIKLVTASDGQLVRAEAV